MDDRISELSDDILSYILTVLSVKDLLKTSILSRRWCKLWAVRRDLFFDIFMLGTTEHDLLQSGYLVNASDTEDKQVNLDKCAGVFVERVDQFIKNFQGTIIDSFLINFYLDCEHSDIIDQWVSFAIERGVGRMDLLFLGTPYKHCTTRRDPYKFDLALFSKTNLSTLNHLSLENCLVYNPINFDFIPFKNLRSLSLVSAKLDETFLESLLSNCPRLQELFLICCELKSLPVIVSSSLCHLKVLCCDLVFNDLKVDANLFLVDCLRLASLECELDTLSIKTPMLKSGKFSISRKQDLKAFVALCATFPQLEILHVEIFPMVKTSIQITQPFKCLKQLNLVLFADSFIYDMGYGLLWILNMLQASPLLQKLSIMFLVPEFFENQKDIRDVEILSHDDIRVIELRGCVGNWYEIEFVKNVLKCAHKLEQIVLSPYWTEVDGFSWNSHPLWFKGGRERMGEKLKDEVVVGREKLVFI